MLRHLLTTMPVRLIQLGIITCALSIPLAAGFVSVLYPMGPLNRAASIHETVSQHGRSLSPFAADLSRSREANGEEQLVTGNQLKLALCALQLSHHLVHNQKLTTEESRVSLGESGKRETTATPMIHLAHYGRQPLIFTANFANTGRPNHGPVTSPPHPGPRMHGSPRIG